VVDKHLVLKNKQTENISNERKLLDSFDYEGIVHLHFTFQDADSLYFGLELCPNGGHLPLCQFYQNGTSLQAFDIQFGEEINEQISEQVNCTTRYSGRGAFPLKTQNSMQQRSS